MAEADADEPHRRTEALTAPEKAASEAPPNGPTAGVGADPADQEQAANDVGGASSDGTAKGLANGSVESPHEPSDGNEDGVVDEADKGDAKGSNKDEGADSDEDPFAGLDDVASMDIYELSNYTFGKKNEESKARAMQMLPKSQIASALQRNYKERGMRRSVGSILLVHSHNFPHVLLLQRSDGKGEYALPGGRLRPGESDEEGLRRKLDSKLQPSGGSGEEDQELDIGEKICNWYAIDFQRRYYPYVPAHITKPKEELHVYTVLLPNKFMFSVPKNLQLVAVPLFELYNNPATYGDVISAVPALLSRWHINYC